MKKLTCLVIILLSFSLLSGYAFAEEEVIELYVGESIPLDTKVISGELIKDQSGIVWNYSSDGICTISSSDTITGKKAGKVTVTGNLNQGSTILEVKFDVLVKNTVKAVEATTPDQNLRVGETFIASYNLIPVDMLPVAINKGIKIKSMDTDVITVTSSGTVTVVGVGTTYVSIESTEAGKKDYIKVTAEPTVDKISIDQKMEEVYVGQTSTLTVTYTPISGETVFLKESDWQSFDTSIIKVDKEGVIEGVKEGKASIRATSKDNSKISSVSVDVLSGVKDIEVSDKKIELSESYKSHQLTANVIPIDKLDEPYESGVTWSTSNSSVCSVSSSGKLTARKTGSATITAESKDGGYKDYTVVYVKLASDTSAPAVKVKNIEFNMNNTTVKVGEKIELEFTLTPENADRSALKFTVRSSGVGKIEKDDDIFYYTALEDGLTYVDASADGNKYDSIVIYSNTMLDGFEISEDTFVKDYGWRVIYLGQKIKMIPEFDMAIGDYPLLDDVKYTSADTKIVKIVDTDYAEALTMGETSITGVTADNGFEDKATLKVISNIKELETEKSARIGVDMAYVPTVYFIAKEDDFYNLDEVLATDFTLELEKVKVSTDFIEKEIEYTENRKNELDELVDKRSGDLNANLEELQKCYQRLFVYESVYKFRKGDYCDLTEANKELTDRNYEGLDVAYIKSNKLYANIVSEIDLKVQSLDPEVFSIITVLVEDNVSSIVIFDENGDIITASVENVLNHYTEDVLFQNNPSSWAVDMIKLANSKGLLVDEVIDNYQAYITREEFMEIVMNFYDVVLDFPEVEVAQDIFTDTDNPVILKAFSLGIINGKAPGVFAPNDNVTREEMCVILSKTLIAMKRELKIMTTYKEFIDQNEISSWAISAVENMTNKYDILSGVGGNQFSPKGNTTKEQAIIVIYKVFRNLK